MAATGVTILRGPESSATGAVVSRQQRPRLLRAALLDEAKSTQELRELCTVDIAPRDSEPTGQALPEPQSLHWAPSPGLVTAQFPTGPSALPRALRAVPCLGSAPADRCGGGGLSLHPVLKRIQLVLISTNFINYN